MQNKTKISHWVQLKTDFTEKICKVSIKSIIFRSKNYFLLFLEYLGKQGWLKLTTYPGFHIFWSYFSVLKKLSLFIELAEREHKSTQV